MRTDKKAQLLAKRRRALRKKVRGSAARPRMSVKFTGRHLYVQFIDDDKGATLASVSTRTKKGEPSRAGANVKTAEVVGASAAVAAIAKGISAVVFDRSGARFHGKVKAVAEAARKGGLQF